MVLLHELKFVIRQEKMRDRIIRRQRELLGDDAREPLAEDEFDVVGNERSKRYYLSSDKNFRRASNQKNALFFANEQAAINAGYRRVSAT